MIHFTQNRWQCHIGYLTQSTVTKNQRKFTVFVPQFLPMKLQNVDLSNSIHEVLNLKNVATGQPIQDKITAASTIIAQYFNVTPCTDVPTMNRGMQVLVLNFGGTDRWFWLPLQRDDNMKTFEHVRVSCLDQAATNKSTASRDDISQRKNGVTDNNTYFIEIDTKYAKHIKLSTASSDGEKYRYHIDMDALAQQLVIWDETSDSKRSNMIRMESKPNDLTNGRISMTTRAGTSVILSGEHLLINVPKNIIVNAGGDIIYKTNHNLVGIAKNNSSKLVCNDSVQVVQGNKSTVTSGNETFTCLSNQQVTIQKEQKIITNKTSFATKVYIVSVETDYTTQTQTYALKSNSYALQLETYSVICDKQSEKTKEYVLQMEKWNSNCDSIEGSIIDAINAIVKHPH